MKTLRNHPESFPEQVTFMAIGIRAIDGDTITVNPNLGFERITQDIDVRVAGVDTPEIVGVDKRRGLMAKAFSAIRIENNWLMITTRRNFHRSFTRYEADVLYWQDGEWRNLAEDLVAEGHIK